MEVVMNSPLLYVAEYPETGGLEVIDKRAGRGGYMRDAAAQRFRAELVQLVSEGADMEGFEDFIGHYESLLNQPVVYH
jgi:hypothetical protein